MALWICKWWHITSMYKKKFVVELSWCLYSPCSFNLSLPCGVSSFRSDYASQYVL